MLWGVSFFKENVSKETIMVILATNPFSNHQTVSFFKGNVSMENVMIILATFPLHHVNLRTAAKETISQHSALRHLSESSPLHNCPGCSFREHLVQSYDKRKSTLAGI